MPSAVAPDASATTHAGQATVILVSPSDPDAGEAEFDVQIGSPPTHGSALSDGFGQLTYTPAAGFTGTDTFTYTATDDLGSAMGTVTVTVTNTPPQAAFDFMDARGGPVSIPVLANDWDPDGDTLSLVGYSYPTLGTVYINGDLLDYTPNPGATGTDTFSYQISDGNGGTVTGTVTVLITADAEIWVSTGSTDFDTGSNWLSGRAPQAGDQIYFLGSMSQINCINMHAPTGGFYNGVTISAGYAGTVTTTTAINAGVLQLDSGNIDQAGNDLTVTGLFNWTGGTLNSGNTDATLHLIGATGTIAPAQYGTVSTRDTLNFDSGSFVTQLPGTLNLLGGQGISLTNATMEAKPTDVNTLIQVQNPSFQGQLTLATGSLYHVYLDNPAVPGRHYLDLAVLNNGGTFTADTGVQIDVLGHLGTPSGPSFFQMSGITNLVGGCALVVNSGFVMTGGNLNVHYNQIQGGKQVKLVGNVLVDGGIVAVSDGPFGTLRVEGNVSWYSGTFLVRASPTTGDSDQWFATGTFTIGSNTALNVTYTPDNLPSGGLSWILLVGEGGLSGSDPQFGGIGNGFEFYRNAPVNTNLLLRRD